MKRKYEDSCGFFGFSLRGFEHVFACSFLILTQALNSRLTISRTLIPNPNPYNPNPSSSNPNRNR